ncbi:MAG: hypothetical protein JXL97_05725 [Bacteroidales bacterium]|nr:hypothetical protein [Bacteroidales bacterium]
MGLTIHYSGIFNAKASLSAFIEDVVDILKPLNFDFQVYETEFPIGIENTEDLTQIYGLSFTPPNCETVSLSFLANRRMSSSEHVHLWGDATDDEQKRFLYKLFTKTQFAGVETHQFIISLFKYLQKRNYFESIDIVDEGKYWETGNVDVLKENFAKYNQILDHVSIAFQSIPIQSGEDIQQYIERVSKRVNDNLNRN